MRVRGRGYIILSARGAVCSVVDLDAARTPDLMRVLDREFGGNTTRGWETTERVLRVASDA